MLTTHYCRSKKKGSNVFIQGSDVEICGKSACMNCRTNWGSPEIFQTICKSCYDFGDMEKKKKSRKRKVSRVSTRSSPRKHVGSKNKYKV